MLIKFIVTIVIKIIHEELTNHELLAIIKDLIMNIYEAD